MELSIEHFGPKSFFGGIVSARKNYQSKGSVKPLKRALRLHRKRNKSMLVLVIDEKGVKRMITFLPVERTDASRTIRAHDVFKPNRSNGELSTKILGRV